MEVLTALLADAANTGEGGKLNVLGIFHVIQAPNFPTIHHHMTLAMEFRGAPQDKGRSFKAEIQLLDPDGRQVMQFPAQINVDRAAPELQPILPFVLNLQNVAFSTAGNYRFEVAIDGKFQTEISLLLVKTGPARSGGETP